MNKETPLKLSVLVSNRGTGASFQSIVSAIKNRELNAEVAMVVSDHPDIAPLTQELIQLNQFSFASRKLEDRKSVLARNNYSGELAKLLNNLGIDIAVLDGFSTILTKSYLDNFKGITLNIHPGLVPDKPEESFLFPDGTIAPWNKELLKDGAVGQFLGGTYAGATIHVVTDEPDYGPVLIRKIVNVEKNDNIESLYKKIKQAENLGIVEALRVLDLRRFI